MVYGGRLPCHWLLHVGGNKEFGDCFYSYRQPLFHLRDYGISDIARSFPYLDAAGSCRRPRRHGEEGRGRKGGGRQAQEEGRGGPDEEARQGRWHAGNAGCLGGRGREEVQGKDAQAGRTQSQEGSQRKPGEESGPGGGAARHYWGGRGTDDAAGSIRSPRRSQEAPLLAPDGLHAATSGRLSTFSTKARPSHLARVGPRVGSTRHPTPV